MPWFVETIWLCLPRLPLYGLLLAVILAVTCGCSGPKESVGQVSGKVTSAAGPVTDANIQFVRPDGVPIGAATLNTFGEFVLQKAIPVGNYQVALLPIVEEVSAEDVDPRRHEEVVKRIPQKYWDSYTSGLTASVKEGKNAFTFRLQ